MSGSLQIEYVKKGSKVILTVSGKVDSSTADQFYAMICKAKDESSFVDVNMRDVTFLSSMGIRSILVAYRQLKTRGGAFRIIGASEQVKNVIGIVNLDLLLAE